MMLHSGSTSQSYTAIDLNKLGELPLDEQSRFVIELRMPQTLCAYRDMILKPPAN
jgi:hypothetical protein